MTIRALSSLSLLVVVAFPVLAEEEPAPAAKKYRGGTIRLGGFFITRMTTTLAVTSDKLPLGTRIDVNQDLGLQDSTTIGRMMLSYRFSRQHRFDFDYYNIERDSTKVLDKTIEIGDTVFPIDVEVYSRVDTEIYKAAYTWMFHDDDKVSLGLSAGLHIVGLGVELNSTDPILGLEEKTGSRHPCRCSVSGWPIAPLASST